MVDIVDLQIKRPVDVVSQSLHKLWIIDNPVQGILEEKTATYFEWYINEVNVLVLCTENYCVTCSI